VEDEVDPSRDVDEVRHIVVLEREALDAEQVLDVRQAAGQEIVDAYDLDAFGQQAIAQVRAEKPRPPSHHRSSLAHGRPPARIMHRPSRPTCNWARGWRK